MPAQINQDSFRYKCAAFYFRIERKVGFIFAKAAALHININTDDSSFYVTGTQFTDLKISLST